MMDPNDENNDEIIGQMVILDEQKYLIPYSYFHRYKIGNRYLLAAVINHTKNE